MTKSAFQMYISALLFSACSFMLNSFPHLCLPVPLNPSPLLPFFPEEYACPAEADEVWKIEWPYANINTLIETPCRKDFTSECVSM